MPALCAVPGVEIHRQFPFYIRMFIRKTPPDDGSYMITVTDFIHLPYTHDLTEGGIAYAVHSLPYTYNRMGGSSYERLRRIVAGVAVELAFRRYLAEQDVPFDVMGATPFTDPDHYDVSLGGRRCDIKSFLITHRDQISDMKRNPQVVLKAPALVPSDQNAAEGHSDRDIYLFAFLSGLVAASPEDMEKTKQTRQGLLLAAHHAGCLEPAGEMESARGAGVEIGGRRDPDRRDRRAGRGRARCARSRSSCRPGHGSR